MQSTTNNNNTRINTNENNRQEADADADEADKDDAKILYNIRLAIGGLMLPTIATTLDHLIFKRFTIIRSTLLRTVMVI